MSVQIETKVAVTVAEMARMVGLSRARFYQLLEAGIFPAPVYDVSTRRPFYVEEAQKVCLEVRRKNCGINGKPVLFYARRHLGTPSNKSPRKNPNRHSELLESLRSLGLTSVTVSQVEEAIKVLFPQGTSTIAPESLLRSIFLHLQRQNSGNNVG